MAAQTTIASDKVFTGFSVWGRDGLVLVIILAQEGHPDKDRKGLGGDGTLVTGIGG
jgi:hypothetical protein